MQTVMDRSKFPEMSKVTKNNFPLAQDTQINENVILSSTRMETSFNTKTKT